MKICFNVEIGMLFLESIILKMNDPLYATIVWSAILITMLNQAEYDCLFILQFYVKKFRSGIKIF